MAGQFWQMESALNKHSPLTLTRTYAIQLVSGNYPSVAFQMNEIEQHFFFHSVGL